MIKVGILLVSILVWSASALAGAGGYIKYGVSISNPDQKGLGEVKYASLGYQGVPWKIFEYQAETGAWLDTQEGDGGGRKSNAFGSFQLGLEPRLNWVYFHSFHGIAVIARRDSTLGSNLQFVHDVGFGVGDKRGVRVGAFYKHLSNAGILFSTINRGRDFVGIRMEIPW
jgi:hypothetical protein